MLKVFGLTQILKSDHMTYSNQELFSTLLNIILAHTMTYTYVHTVYVHTFFMYICDIYILYYMFIDILLAHPYLIQKKEKIC